MIQKDSFWLKICPSCFSHSRSHAFVRSHQFPTWVGRIVVLLKSNLEDSGSMWAKYVRKFERPSGVSEFYFKWSKFALKRCNLIRSGEQNAILGGSFEARLEKPPKSCSSTDKDCWWPTEPEPAPEKGGERRIKVENIRSNRTRCLFELEGRKAEQITGRSICSHCSSWRE